MAVPGPLPMPAALQPDDDPSAEHQRTVRPKAKMNVEAFIEAQQEAVPVRGRDVPHPRRGRSRAPS